ncbi:heme o synthase [Phenylobacterium sp.]|uniref:heme o synthase n=1 Tax=Phenylobacterium sp. TaxID=1871053 RepID=UPI002F3E3EDA
MNSWLFYVVANRLTEGRIPRNVSDFRLVDRRVYETINLMEERNRFVRGLFAWVGFRTTGVEAERQPRVAGTSGAHTLKVLDLAIKGIFAHSYLPLKVISIFGLTLSFLSVLALALIANLLAAALLAFTIFYYVVIYTMWLKRRTPQNIVIGGAAGALPPIVGCVAASGGVTLDSLTLFAIIFMWTPPHFWALALYTSDDYGKAGVPMMPNVAGAKSTRRQILLYSLLLAPLCVAPAFTGLGGRAYLGVSAGGAVVFLLLAWRLFRSRAGDAPGERNDGLYDVKAEARAARNLFAFSILYLTLLFATLLVEHLAGWPPLALLAR